MRDLGYMGPWLQIFCNFQHYTVFNNTTPKLIFFKMMQTTFSRITLSQHAIKDLTVYILESSWPVSPRLIWPECWRPSSSTLAMHCFSPTEQAHLSPKAYKKIQVIRTPDKVHNSIFVMPISSPNPMFDHLLESSHWPNIHVGFSKEM